MFKKFRQLEGLGHTIASLTYRALADIAHHPIRGSIHFPRSVWRGCTLILRRHANIGAPEVLKSGGTRMVPGTREMRAGELTMQPKSGFAAATDQSGPVEIVFDDRIGEVGWKGWTRVRSARLMRGGILLRVGIRRFSGVVKGGVPVSPGSSYRLRLEAEISQGDVEAYWVVRNAESTAPLTSFNENQVAIVPLRRNFLLSTSAPLDFRVFSEAQRLDFYLLLRNCKVGQSVKVTRVVLGRIPPARAYPRPPLGSGEKIIASIASIPRRQLWLKDAVMSLYPQVDEIRVFLNAYDDVPKFLEDEKIVVERSQTWGDLGDAGKFFWADDSTPGYRFICDDDIVYPTNYVYRMIEELHAYSNTVILGTHGVLLKQPLENYYDKKSRYTVNCRDANIQDFTCHLLGTGAVAYHTEAIQLARTDFEVPNMADVWFAKQAHKQDVPLICLRRFGNWVITRTEDERSSIYDHSTTGQASGLNTAKVQSDVLRSLYPISITSTRSVNGRKKLVMAIKTYNRLAYLKDCLQSFLRTCGDDNDWIIVIADDGSTDGTLEFLDDLIIPYEFHVLRNKRRYAVGQCNSIFELARKIGFDLGFMVDDDLVFAEPGWDELYIEAVRKSGYDHLSYINEAHFEELNTRIDPLFKMPQKRIDPSGSCETYIDVEQCMGALFTFTPKMLDTIGAADEVNFPIRGQWHIDLSMRACRAGFNDAKNFYDCVGSNDYLMLQNEIEEEHYRLSIPWNNAKYKNVREPEELARRREIIADETRIYVAPR